MSIENPLASAIDRLGGATAVARSLGESVQTVCNWLDRGVPASKAKGVEKLTGISVRELRPSDWHLYWPAEAPKRAAKV